MKNKMVYISALLSGSSDRKASRCRWNSRTDAGSSVQLEMDVSERDKYGRLLAYVWINWKRGWIVTEMAWPVNKKTSPAIVPGLF